MENCTLASSVFSSLKILKVIFFTPVLLILSASPEERSTFNGMWPIDSKPYVASRPDWCQKWAASGLRTNTLSEVKCVIASFHSTWRRKIVHKAMCPLKHTVRSYSTLSWVRLKRCLRRAKGFGQAMSPKFVWPDEPAISVWLCRSHLYATTSLRLCVRSRN